MRDSADKIVFACYGLFGAGLGLLVFMFALDGWSFLFTGRATEPWNGVLALILCCALGGGWGLVSYKIKDREFNSGGSDLFYDSATAIRFGKRLLVIATCLAGLYFVWQLTRTL